MRKSEAKEGVARETQRVSTKFTTDAVPILLLEKGRIRERESEREAVKCKGSGGGVIASLSSHTRQEFSK